MVNNTTGLKLGWFKALKSIAVKGELQFSESTKLISPIKIRCPLNIELVWLIIKNLGILLNIFRSNF